MIYFSSDLHLYFENEEGDFFERIGERNTLIVNNWNKTVTDEDEVYILGDFSDEDGKNTNKLLKHLNGKKYLVRGNHDKYVDDDKFDKSLFVWIKDYYELKELGTKFVLFHYPIEVWTGYGNNRFHIHGHLHRTKPIMEPIRRYDCGVDGNNMTPVSLEYIYNQLKQYNNMDRIIAF